MSTLLFPVQGGSKGNGLQYGGSGAVYGPANVGQWLNVTTTSDFFDGRTTFGTQAMLFFDQFGTGIVLASPNSAVALENDNFEGFLNGGDDVFHLGGGNFFRFTSSGSAAFTTGDFDATHNVNGNAGDFTVDTGASRVAGASGGSTLNTVASVGGPDSGDIALQAYPNGGNAGVIALDTAHLSYVPGFGEISIGIASGATISVYNHSSVKTFEITEAGVVDLGTIDGGSA